MDTPKKICPRVHCGGELELKAVCSTDMFYADYDRNDKREIWCCSKCDGQFWRDYKWRMVGAEECDFCERRSVLKPGHVIETYFGDEGEWSRFNGIRATIVRPLGQNEDCGGTFDYVVSWDWRDPKLYQFIRYVNRSNASIVGLPDGNIKDLLEPRVSLDWVRPAGYSEKGA